MMQLLGTRLTARSLPPSQPLPSHSLRQPGSRSRSLPLPGPSLPDRATVACIPRHKGRDPVLGHCPIRRLSQR